MRVRAIVNAQPSGLWKDSPDQLRACTTAGPLSKAERKWLETEILLTQKVGKQGRLINLLTLALAFDKVYWSDWIRKSPVLRASKYDLNPKIPMFLCASLLEYSKSLSFDPGFCEYLASTQNLLKITTAFRDLQISTIQILFRERSRVIKSALVVVELAFLGRREFGTLVVAGLIPESLADGFSYLMYLYASRIGQARGGTEGVDPRCMSTNLYLDLVSGAHALSNYGQWEFLISHFGYVCEFDKESDSVHINAPTHDFAKSLRLGYVSTFIQRLALARTIESQDAMSLDEAGAKLSKSLQKEGLIVMRENPVRRWTFALPEVDKLKELVRSDKLFKEEVDNVMSLSKDLLSTPAEIESFSIRGVKMHSLLRAQRFANLLRAVISKFLATQLQGDPEAVAQSIIPVYDRPSLLRFIAYGAGEEFSETILDSLTWKPDENKMFDVMYQPIIPIENEHYMMPFNIFGSADVVRNTMQLFQKRLRDGQNDILSERLRQVLNDASWKAANDVKYKYGGFQGDIDTICMHEGALFVFECKNSLHPCSMAELRTSFDHILHSQEQLDKFKTLWEQEGFRKYLSKRLGWDLAESSTVTTCVVTGNRMFVGMRFGSHAIRSFFEIGNFIHPGVISVSGKDVELRSPGLLSSLDLQAFIEQDILHKKTLAAMARKDEVVKCGKVTVVREDYVLDQEMLARSFGVTAGGGG